MNVHHLELFYYVARHGGISEAVRNIPYGIQQPAVSGQVIQLEEYLGLTLFHRRPFELTPAGHELYQFIQPFFENLQPMADKLRGGVAQYIRVGGSEIVLRDHLPRVLLALRRRFPKLKVSLREGYHPQLVAWLEKRELDVALTLLDGKPPPGITAQPLLKLPMVLLVPKNSKRQSADELWQEDRINEPLVSVPANEPMCRSFQRGLARRKVDWLPGIEVSTVDLVQTYVINGYGIGLAVAVPGMKYHSRIRFLPLEGFDPIDFGVLWQGKVTPILEACLEAIHEAARDLSR